MTIGLNDYKTRQAELVDTHCHIHFPDYELDPEEVVKEAIKDGVTQLLCVGCTLTDSKLAVEFAARHENIWASVGLHPHEGAVYVHDHAALQQFRSLVENHAQLSRLDEAQGGSEERREAYREYGEQVPELATQRFAKSTGRVGGSATKQASATRKLVAIGETGLDYHYMHSSKEDQEKLFRFQLSLAQEHDLPLIFHVREAFDDFFKILDDHKGVRGVVHSFSAGKKELDEILARDLCIGVNGIVTFTKFAEQLEAVRAIPLDKLLLETDAPFLTPVPFRGTICQPKYVRVTAEFLADLRGESLDQLAHATTQNARALFNLE